MKKLIPAVLAAIVIVGTITAPAPAAGTYRTAYRATPRIERTNDRMKWNRAEVQASHRRAEWLRLRRSSRRLVLVARRIARATKVLLSSYRAVSTNAIDAMIFSVFGRGPTGFTAECIADRESGDNPLAVNSSSGAAGLFQFYPMPSWDWRDPMTNIQHALALYQSRGWEPWGGGC